MMLQWLDELKRDYPWLYMYEASGPLLEYCSPNAGSERRIRILAALLGQEGGIYVGSSTWILNFPPSFRSVDVDVGLDPDATEGYMILRAGVLGLNGSVADLLRERGARPRRRSTCGRIHHIYHRPDLANHTGACLVVSGDGFERFYPMDIWELDDAFGRLARRLFYGTEEIRRPAPSTSPDLVPNIAHMIWVGGGRMSYVFYLSVLSLLYVAGVDVVYIHGNMPPTGSLWDEIRTLPQTRDRVKFITRTLPLKVCRDGSRNFRKGGRFLPSSSSPVQGFFKDNVTAGDIRLKVHGRGVTRGTLVSRLTARHYAICIQGGPKKVSHYQFFKKSY